MEREEKKYTILPGVKTPDIKAIVGAASDFTNPGVEDLQIKGFDYRKTLKTDSEAKAPTAEDIAKLNALGDKVAEEEARSAEESRKKMEAIKNAAVTAPEDLSSLQKAAAKSVTAEKREIIEKEQAEKAAKAAEEEAKLKMREERRLAQQRVLEETLAKKAEIQERNRKEAEEKAAAEEKAKKEAEKARKVAEAKTKKEESASNSKSNSDDEDYKAWVKAKREAAIAEAAKKGGMKVAPKESVVETKATQESKQEAPKVETPKAEETKKEAPIASANETLDDFSEFL